MGQFHSIRSRKSDDRVAACVKGKGPQSELNIFRSRPTSNHKTKPPPPTQPQFQPNPKMIPHPEHNPKTEDEKMEGVHFESPQPIPKPKQPRRPGQVPKVNVIEEIMQQNKKDVASYTLSSPSIFQQARDEDTFVGEAFYYYLNHKKALDLIHGTYMIIYARPVVAEKDMYGDIVSEVFEPSMKNTICIFTKPIPARSPGHRKVNELLNQGLPAVGMLHFRSRNLTLWYKDKYADSNTTVFAHAHPGKSPTVEVEETANEGSFDHALQNAISRGRANCSFGSRVTQHITDTQSFNSIKFGFEFITLEFPFLNRSGEEEKYLCVAVKIPEKTEVASRFILHQKLYCPFSKETIMVSYLPQEVDFKPKYPVKRKVNKVTIAPRPPRGVPFKSNNGAVVKFPPGLTKSTSSSALPGKHTTKRWSSKAKEEVIEEVDEAVEINVDSDTETVKE